MSKVRVREGVASIVYVDETKSRVVLVADQSFDASDPVVRAHPWAFDLESDVEQATARPGERRAARRPA